MIQSLNLPKKFCLWDFMIPTNVSVAICLLPIRQFCLFGKMSNTGIKTSQNYFLNCRTAVTTIVYTFDHDEKFNFKFEK